MVGGALLMASLASMRAPYRTDDPCPGGGQTLPPVSVHLMPSIIRHQSYVGVHSSSLRVGMKLFACTDGRLIGETLVDDEDLAEPITTIGIPTRWVASMWLAGRLDEYRTVDRWLVLIESHQG